MPSGNPKVHCTVRWPQQLGLRKVQILETETVSVIGPYI